MLYDACVTGQELKKVNNKTFFFCKKLNLSLFTLHNEHFWLQNRKFNYQHSKMRKMKMPKLGFLHFILLKYIMSYALDTLNECLYVLSGC